MILEWTIDFTRQWVLVAKDAIQSKVCTSAFADEGKEVANS